MINLMIGPLALTYSIHIKSMEWVLGVYEQFEFFKHSPRSYLFTSPARLFVGGGPPTCDHMWGPSIDASVILLHSSFHINERARRGEVTREPSIGLPTHNERKWSMCHKLSPFVELAHWLIGSLLR